MIKKIIKNSYDNSYFAIYKKNKIVNKVKERIIELKDSEINDKLKHYEDIIVQYSEIIDNSIKKI